MAELIASRRASPELCAAPPNFVQSQTTFELNFTLPEDIMQYTVKYPTLQASNAIKYPTLQASSVRPTHVVPPAPQK